MITGHEERITRTKHVALEFSVTSHQRISGILFFQWEPRPDLR
jgi:hypothetical protein